MAISSNFPKLPKGLAKESTLFLAFTIMSLSKPCIPFLTPHLTLSFSIPSYF